MGSPMAGWKKKIVWTMLTRPRDYTEIRDWRREGADLANMRQAYKRLRDVTRARELWEEALHIYEEIEDPHAEWVRGWLRELGE